MFIKQISLITLIERIVSLMVASELSRTLSVRSNVQVSLIECPISLFVLKSVWDRFISERQMIHGISVLIPSSQ